MKKIAVFGKPGSGKSTFSRALAAATKLPLYPLDTIVYQPNGAMVDRETFQKKHQQILESEAWIVDGFGPIGAFYERLEKADTLIYVDLPYPQSYWLVTKRLLKGLFVTPEGWPEGSSIIKGTLSSYKMLRLSPQFWNDDFGARLDTLAQQRAFHRVTNLTDLQLLVNSLLNNGREGQ